MPGLPAETRVAVAGLGSIGAEVVKALDRGIEGLTLTAVLRKQRASLRIGT